MKIYNLIELLNGLKYHGSGTVISEECAYLKDAVDHLAGYADEDTIEVVSVSTQKMKQIYKILESVNQNKYINENEMHQLFCDIVSMLENTIKAYNIPESYFHDYLKKFHDLEARNGDQSSS